MSTKKVSFEMAMRDTKVAHERLGRGLVAFHGEVVDHLKLNKYSDITLLVRINPALREAFQACVKPLAWDYRPPTFFDNGTLFPIYASPEDEVNNVKTKAALAYEKWERHREG